MLPYIARVSDPFEPFSQAHMRDDFEVESFEDTYVRGSVATGKLVVKNPGLTLLDPNAPQWVIISESPDGTAASGRVIFRGRIVPQFRVGNDVATGRIELSLEASPLDLKARQLTYAQANLLQRPAFDELADDLDFDNLAGVLVATSKSWFVQPATLAVSVIDNLEGDRVFDLDSNYDHSSFRLGPTGTAPARRIKARAQVQITQRAYGYCNIAGQVNGPNTFISTLDADHFETQRASLPTQLLNFATGGGWKKEEGSDVLSGYQRETGFISTGRLVSLQPSPIFGDNGPIEQAPVVTSERASLWGMSYAYLYNYMLYDYTQSRVETIQVYLDYPVQDVAGVTAVVDIGDVSVKDPYIGLRPNTLPPPEPDQYGDYIYPYSPLIPVLPHSYEAIYMQGDLVTIGLGATYRCLDDITQGPFYDINLGPVISHRHWEEVPSLAAIPDRRAPSFCDTLRGQQFLEHVILRCEAKARNLSLAAKAEFTTNWEFGSQIRLRDTVRLTYWDSSTRSARVLKGTVKERRRKRDKSPKMSFVLSIPCGDSSDVEVPQVGPTVYVDPTLGADAYYRNVTSHLGLSRQQLRDQYLSIFNFTEGYPETLLGSFGFGQIAWTYGSQPLIAPVDAFQLSNPFYSVFRVQHINEAAYQYGQAIQYGFRGWDPRDAVFENPTAVNVTMRNIASGGTIERRYDVAAQCMRGPRGIDLVTGGEP